MNNSLPFNTLINNQLNNGNTSAPKAFLNVVFFDEQFKFIEQDATTPDVGTSFTRVSTANNASAGFAPLQQKAPRNGYVFVYLSNQSNETVYYDEFFVTQEHSRIFEEFKYTGFIRKHGCGVRLNEGASLALNDLQQDRKVLHVRKGKHYKKRFVPVAQKNFEEIILYIKYARSQLLQEIKTDALFIDENKGSPMHKQSFYVRIKKLVNKANIKKKAGTHTLRHSIATHLLQLGWKPERIKDFLGRILTARRSIHIYQMKCNELQSVFTAMQIQPCNH